MLGLHPYPTQFSLQHVFQVTTTSHKCVTVCVLADSKSIRLWMNSSWYPFRISVDKLDEAPIGSLKALANQTFGDKGGSSFDYTPMLKWVRAHNIVYVVNILQRCKLRYSLWVVVMLLSSVISLCRDNNKIVWSASIILSLVMLRVDTIY